MRSLNPSKAAVQKRKIIFKRAETYVKDYLNAEKEEIRLRRVARAAGDFHVSAQPRLYFVVRIKGYVQLTQTRSSGAHLIFFAFSINKIAPKPRKILQLLRLLQINNGIFIKVNKATGQMLKLVEPYITYG